MSNWLIRSKKRAIHTFLVSDLNEFLMVTHFWWVIWAFCAYHSFLVRNLSKRFISLISKEGMSEWLFFLTYKKLNKKYDFSQQILSESLIFVSERANEQFTQKISNLLIFHERPERISHSRSFVMSELSESLTVTDLSWVIWVNRSQSLIWSERYEHMSDERMSKFQTLAFWIF